MINYYNILNISETVSQEEIESAYKKLALKYHPDRNKDKDASEKFKQISEAYEILKDKNKRLDYDNRRKGINEFNIFSTIFKSNPRSANLKPTNLKTTVKITLEEILTGCEKTLKIKKPEPCFSCSGSGFSKFKFCSNCNGTGKVNLTLESPFITQIPCHFCKGKGKEAIEKCAECNGVGKIKNKQSEILINVPKGANENTVIRVLNEGEKTSYGTGHLFVNVEVLPHEKFLREDCNLIYNFYAKYSQLVLGTEVEIPTLDGLVKLKIPPETKNGTKFKLKNLGLPEFSQLNRGDLIVKVYVDVKKIINEKHKLLLEELKQIEESNG